MFKTKFLEMSSTFSCQNDTEIGKGFESSVPHSEQTRRFVIYVLRAILAENDVAFLQVTLVTVSWV